MSISKVMIIGSGQMGSGIAQVFAQSGFTVYLNDIKEEFVQRGLDGITKQLSRSVEKGRLSEEDKDSILANLIPSTSYEDAKHAQLVIEAATENRDIKLSIFKQLDELTDPQTILASNTSSLSITDIAAATVHQEKAHVGLSAFLSDLLKMQMDSDMVTVTTAFQITLQAVGNIMLSNSDIARSQETVFNHRLNHTDSGTLNLGFFQI